MSVKPRSTKKGKVYDVRLRGPDGREVSRTFRTRREADQFQATQVTARARGAWVDPRGGSVTFRKVAEEWLECNPAKRASTRARDYSALRTHVLPAVGDRRIGSLTPADIRGLVGRWNESLAPRSVGRVYGTMRAVLNFAVECETIAKTPCRGIRLPAVQPAKVRIVTSDELAALSGAMRSEYAAMAWIGAVLGLRWGEVAGLRVGSVDVLRRTVSVVEQVTRGKGGQPVVSDPKSKAGQRELMMPGALADLLSHHLAQRGLTGADSQAFLFAAAGGQPLDYTWWRRRVWLPALDAAGLHGVGFHDLRRANATEMVRAKVDVKTAQARLGHSDPRLTLAIYAQATTEGDAEAAERLGDRFMGRSARTSG